jgi:hypothetical protein
MDHRSAQLDGWENLFRRLVLRRADVVRDYFSIVLDRLLSSRYFVVVHPRDHSY